jgi:hypothetical protein
MLPSTLPLPGKEQVLNDQYLPLYIDLHWSIGRGFHPQLGLSGENWRHFEAI